MPELRDKEELLSLSALFEREFSIDWLVELSGFRASRVLSALEEALSAGTLEQVGPGVYRFADQRTREALGLRLSPQERADFHQLIAALLSQELPEGQEKILAISRHLIEAPVEGRTAAYLVDAGDFYSREFRAEEALACYGKVLGSLAGAQDSRSRRIYVRAAINCSKISTGHYDSLRVVELLKQAMQMAREEGLESSQALIDMHMAKNYHLMDRYGLANTHFERGWTMAKNLAQPELMNQAATFSRFFLFWQGRFREAVASYEAARPDVERYPHGGFHLRSLHAVGHCYAQIGQITQGLGMLDSIRSHCREIGNAFNAPTTDAAMARILLEIRRLDDAMVLLKRAAREAKALHNHWALLSACAGMAYAHYLSGDNERSARYLEKMFRISRRIKVSVRFDGDILGYCWAMETGGFPVVAGLDLTREIESSIRSSNVYIKGLGYRYKAMLQDRRGQNPEKVLKSYQLAVKWLGESGNKFDLARARVFLARHLLKLGRGQEADQAIAETARLLAPLNASLVPEDLQPFLEKRRSAERLTAELAAFGRKMSVLATGGEQLAGILSAFNALTNAERGAVFTLIGPGPLKQLYMASAKNFTQEDLTNPSFIDSLEMISRVAETGEGLMRASSGRAETGREPDQEVARSAIAAPIRRAEAVVGVLYHDNRVLPNAFRETDMELMNLMAMFAGLALESQSMREDITRLREKFTQAARPLAAARPPVLDETGLVGQGPAMTGLVARIGQVAPTNSTVLILGETGVGKELVARAIHRASGRASRPFISVHIGSLPETLVASELFGHERGAFTGANRQLKGRFELADTGTLFLDEIGELSAEMQVRLLRVLETGRFERLGSERTIGSDFRLIAATNRDLGEAMRQGRFRSDLFYRLNVFPIHIPPLRRRAGDIPALAHHFLAKTARRMGKSLTAISPEQMERLTAYSWPGNVRELENMIERAVIVSQGPVLELGPMPEDGQTQAPGGLATLRQVEKAHVLAVLEATGWKVRGPGGAAQALDLNPSTLEFRMKKLGLKRPKGQRVRRGRG